MILEKLYHISGLQLYLSLIGGSSSKVSIHSLFFASPKARRLTLVISGMLLHGGVGLGLCSKMLRRRRRVGNCQELFFWPERWQSINPCLRHPVPHPRNRGVLIIPGARAPELLGFQIYMAATMENIAGLNR